MRGSTSNRLFLCVILCYGLIPDPTNATTYYVAKNGNDNDSGTVTQPWLTIQKAANTLAPGDTVLMKAGVYNEKITINVSGSGGKYITFRNYANDTVIIDGTGVPGNNLIYINNKNYLRIEGVEICNNLGVSDGSGIRIEDGGEYIEIRDNKIHDIRGSDAMGITVYAHSSDVIRYLKIDNNEIYNCEPAQSEALTLNGDVWDSEVTNNRVHDVNNIGIDFIGGEVPGKVCRRCLCKGNVVYRARSIYGGGYGAGIYIDGGVDITLEGNIVYECDLGIEVGCENAGYVADGCIVWANLLYNNDKAGLGFGGYSSSVGRVKNCNFTNNTLYKNQMLQDGNGELWIQYASENVVENNIFYAGPQGILLSSWEGNVNNILNYNCWFPSTGSHPDIFIWNGTSYDTYNAYKMATGQDVNSIQWSPEFINGMAYDFHLQQTSPCIDAGNPNTPPNFDFDGNPIPQDGDADGDSVVDIGAYEYIPAGVEHNPTYVASLGLSITPTPTYETAHIKYTLDKEANVKIAVYNNAGQMIKLLKDATLKPSSYTIDWNVSEIPNGVYFCKLSIKTGTITKKFIAVK